MMQSDRVELPGCREAMSDLADGELDAAEAACRQWRDDPQAREAWAAYHLIGDAMRSRDLLSRRGSLQQQVFLEGLRVRLAAEPVVLAPTVERESRRRWLVPTSAAAGFVAVAGVVWLLRGIEAPQQIARGPSIVQGPSAAAPAPTAASAGAEPTLQVVNGQMVRDARLDGYLRAHRSGSQMLPGRNVGSFETVALER